MRIISIVVCLLLLTLTGCGQHHPETASVAGRITFNGKPVAGGQIMFYPDNGRPAMSVIDADGHYSLTTFKSDDGAMLGHHRVTIDARRNVKRKRTPKTTESPNTMEAMLSEEGSDLHEAPKVEWLAPERYASPTTSTLTAEVKSGDNTVDFDLK
jgi:hypothetical protein